MSLEITRIETTEFAYPLEDIGLDAGFNLVYDPGSTTERRLFAIRIHTDDGVTGAFVGLWVLITPFFWGAAVGDGINWWATSGIWLYWSNIISGIVVAILAGYSAQSAGAGSESATAA